MTRIPIRSMLLCGILALVLAACLSSNEALPGTHSASQSPATTAPTASPHTSHTAISHKDDTELVATLYEMLGHWRRAGQTLSEGIGHWPKRTRLIRPPNTGLASKRPLRLVTSPASAERWMTTWRRRSSRPMTPHHEMTQHAKRSKM